MREKEPSRPNWLMMNHTNMTSNGFKADILFREGKRGCGWGVEGILCGEVCLVRNAGSLILEVSG